VDRTPPPVIDRETLAPVVERACGRPLARTTWEVAPIGEGSLGLSAGMYRVTGAGSDGTRWSVVLKMLRPIPATFLERFPEADRAQLAEAYGWDREARLYESGLLDRLPDGLVAARCLGIRRIDDGCWLWFEDLGPNDEAWDPARYALAARHLGRFNGAFADPALRPEDAWICREWIRTWVLAGIGSFGGAVVANEAIWTHPLIREAFPADAAVRLRRVWDRRHEILDRLDALPQTFCHMDAFRPNLFDRIAAGTRQTVAIDWSYAGIAPIGADVGHLVVGSTLPMAGHAPEIGALAAAALPGYIDGLRDGGWDGPAADVQAAFALSAIRWVFMLRQLGAVLDPEQQKRVARWAGEPYPALLARLARRTVFLLGLIEGA